MENLRIENAAAVVDRMGFYFKKTVLQELAVGDVVRISYTFTQWEESPDLYNSDSPYIRIELIKGEELCGEILNLNHDEEAFKYPIRAGERIWFRRENIFEIDTRDSSEERQKKILDHLVDGESHVLVTGVAMLLIDDDS